MSSLTPQPRVIRSSMCEPSWKHFPWHYHCNANVKYESMEPPRSFIEILTAYYVPLKPTPTSLHSKAYVSRYQHWLLIHLCTSLYLHAKIFGWMGARKNFYAIIFSCNFLCHRCWITADLLPKYIAPCFRLFCYVALSLKSLWCMVNCHQSLSCILFPCWLNMSVIIVTGRGIANLSWLLAFQLRNLFIE